MSIPPTDLRTAPRDQLTISTPELVTIEFPLAGLGSRFIAILLDYLLQGVSVTVLALIFVLLLSGAVGNRVASTANNLSAKWAVAIAIAIPFLLEWGYFSLFEAFWRGQTPGKRIMKIRVIQQTGRSISLFESLGRNLLRVIDWLPSFYIIGVISMFVTRRQQRLGDLVAGTLVVHEREIEFSVEAATTTRTITTGLFRQATPPPPPRESRLPADAVAKLTLADLQALESYMTRRLDVPLETRLSLSARLAENISRKMDFAIPAGMSQESFLEEAAKSLRSMQHLTR